MKYSKSAATHLAPISVLLENCDHKVAVTWAADCAEHVLSHFEMKHPGDKRPRQAIGIVHEWTLGKVTVSEARSAALAAHESAQLAKDDASRAAARAAGHAVATIHVAAHAAHAAIYAVTSIALACSPVKAQKESEWQHQRLQFHLSR